MIIVNQNEKNTTFFLIDQINQIDTHTHTQGIGKFATSEHQSINTTTTTTHTKHIYYLTKFK